MYFYLTLTKAEQTSQRTWYRLISVKGNERVLLQTVNFDKHGKIKYHFNKYCKLARTDAQILWDIKNTLEYIIEKVDLDFDKEYIEVYR